MSATHGPDGSPGFDQDVVERCEQFLADYAKDDVAELAKHYPREQQSLVIDYMDVLQFDLDLADDLREQPRRMLRNFEEAVRRFDLPIDMSLDDVDVRVVGVGDPMHVSELRTTDNLARLCPITGQVTKISTVAPRPEVAVYECQRCGTPTEIPVDGLTLEEPHQCHGCERKGPFRILSRETIETMEDHQFIRIQDPPGTHAGGGGQKIDIAVTGDLCGRVEPGDRVHATGIYELDTDDPDSARFDTRVDGVHVETEDTDFEDLDIAEFKDDILALASGERGDPYELLVDSIAPSLYGGGDIKEAIGLQLFGGVRKENPDGTAERGDPHILLLGDPGTGKSTLLDAVAAIAPRSVITSGKGSSAAGMTAAAVRDNEGFGDGQWTLKAGALVLADGGLACIDEIDKMTEEAIDSMHRAMEQQEVSVSKAGIKANLQSQTAVLAGGNPKYGRFDPYEPFAEQIELDSAMINRFDLLFMVTDEPDYDEDKQKAMYMLDTSAETSDPAVDLDLLRAWIAYAKQHCEPAIRTDADRERVAQWYASFRESGSDDESPIPINARNLKAVTRFAEASARVRLSDTVQQQDVQRATKLFESCMRDVGVDPETEQFDVDMLESGTSKSQRDRKSTLEKLIRDHGPVAEEELIELADDRGIDDSEVLHELGQWRDSGDVFDMGDGIRWTEGFH